MCKVLRAADGSFIGYKGIQGSFEELCKSGAVSADEPGILQCHGQGCVYASWGLDDANNPLTTAIVIITLSEGQLGKD
jgi:hypothetical protein